MHRIRRSAAVAVAAALALPLGLASASAAPADAPRSAAVQADPFPGVYISPWGDADVAISDETWDWLDREGFTLDAISPFKMDADKRGFSMPIGSTAGDGLDSKGRIFYPGGLNLHHARSGKTFTLKPTYIRVMPTPGYSAGVSVDGKVIDDEVMVAETTAREALVGARPSPTGFRLEKVPFRVTKELSDLFTEQTGRPGPRVGSLFGTLTPHFDYVPTGPQSPTGFPSL
ncbi:hypothetical protein [Streptomyces sp. NPDC002790]|uniref:hypothetical protein n=1 Tax=Streptomyces sp. NPDC002790 TaxID=3154431 RepID=UPI00331CD5C2